MGRLVTTPEAYQLLHDGYLALSEVEAAGVRVDDVYLENALKETRARIKEYDAILRADPLYGIWRKLFGDKSNLGSHEQLARLVFGELGIESKRRTESDDRESGAEDAYKHVNIPFVKTWFEQQKYIKVHGTYLTGIKREMVRGGDGLWYVHPIYNGNRAITHRSSCVAKGTLVEVVRDVSKFPKGIPIEHVKAGDLVYCYDDNLNLAVRRVTWAGKTGTKRVLRLHWTARSKSGYLDVTSDHRIRLSDGRYVTAGSLLGRPHTRRDNKSPNAPKCSVLAMGRIGDRLYQTGRVDSLWDHRLVYESVVGPLKNSEVVHHKDGNHLNNAPTNLEKMTQSQHAVTHDLFNDDIRRMGVKARQRNHALFGDRWPSGEDSPTWISLTKIRVLRILAGCGGSATEVRNRGLMDFNTFKRKMILVGVDQAAVRRRYDASGRYITRGAMIKASGRGVGPAAKSLRVGYYNARKLYEERGIEVGIGLGRGVRVNNHSVVWVEELDGLVDVYDLSVEEFHNFIAAEICVHNCSDPNFQNNPVRNPLAGEYVRRCYIPRPGYQLLELDYGQIEVRIPCCYHSDPVLMDYVNDSTKDMHRDTACQLFMLKPGEVGKEVRHVSKNEFVFPTFYGSYYAQCAPHIWETLEHRNLKVEGSSQSIRDHLASKGIRELGACNSKESPVRGTFEYLVKEIEDDFWGNRFKVYAQWKRDWYANYLRQGGFRMLSGFAINLPLDRKQVCNSPIQGVAFHCCLWSLIRIVRHLRRYKMRTRVIGEVHDCINFDAHPAERDDVIFMARRIMTEEIKRWAPWLNVPLTVEPEACPIDASWFDKMALVERGDTWMPEKLDKWEQKYGLWSNQLGL